MALLPYMPWHPQDFAMSQDVQEMTDDEELAYRRLLDKLWVAKDRGLPSDRASLARAVKFSVRRWAKCEETLMKCLFIFNSRAFHPRILRDIKSFLESRKGRKSKEHVRLLDSVRHILTTFDQADWVRNAVLDSVQKGLFNAPHPSPSPSPSPNKSSSRTPSSLTSQALDGARGKTEEDEEGDFANPFPEEEEAKNPERELVLMTARVLRPRASEAKFLAALAAAAMLRRDPKTKDLESRLRHYVGRGWNCRDNHDEDEAARILRRSGLTYAELGLGKGGAREKSAIVARKVQTPAGSHPAGAFSSEETCLNNN